MLRAVILLIVGGPILAAAGLLLPAKFAAYGVVFPGLFWGGAIFVIVREWKGASSAQGTLPFVLGLIASGWAALDTIGGCLAFPAIPVCSATKITVLVLLEFFAPLFIIAVTWLSTHSRKS